MSKEEQKTYVNEFRPKLITPEEEAMWKRGTSNAGVKLRKGRKREKAN